MKHIAGILLFFISFTSQATELSFDQKIDQLLTPVANLFSSIIFYSIEISGTQLPIIVVWLTVAAFFFTAYFGFINFRGFSHSIKVIKGDFSDPKDTGEISHFQALTTALSSTVGLGNIAGVAIAVSIGGPGATFWMIIAGFMSMSTKFIECTLGVKYRHIDANGKVHGGPMYYLRDGLANLGYKKLGKFLAVFFAICCSVANLCGGNMLQSNQAYQQFVTAFVSEDSMWLDNAWLFGLLLALVIGVVIIGGIKSITKVTEKLVPFMVTLYLSAAMFVLLSHFNEIPQAFGIIIDGAFQPIGIAGGIVGVMIQGLKRATFSNEAGVGMASIVHAAASTKYPIREGYVALIEPFVDTVVICTITALVIVITGSYSTVDGMDGVALTSKAFSSVIWWFPYVLSVCVVLFAISTMIASAYFGSIAWGYLVGESKALDLFYKLIFCTFTVIGASASLDAVIAISDSIFFSMSIANIIGLYILAPQIKADLKIYQNKYCHKIK